MTRTELTKPNRQLLIDNYSLRAKISADIGTHELTIRRWALNNSPKLTTNSFLDHFTKHSGVSENLIVEHKIPQHLDH